MTDSAQDSPFRPYRDLPFEDLALRLVVFSAMTEGLAGKLALTEKIQKRFPKTEPVFNYGFRKTAGKIFFGGETLEDAKDRCEELLKKGTGVIIDYAAKENGTDQPKTYYEGVRTQLEGVIEACKDLKKDYPKSTVAMAVKLSTLANYGDLKELSAAVSGKEPLTPEQAQKYKDIRTRFEDIITYANERNVKVFVDAEKTEINELIRNLCFRAADKGMKLSMTVQAYLRETATIGDKPGVIDRILSRDNPPDIKLVRGAYMGKGYEDEKQYIWNNGEQGGKAMTDHCYDESFEKLYRSGRIQEITAATHNQQSLTKIGTLLDGPGNADNSTKVGAATLLGMGEGLIIHPKMEKIKYVPFGKELNYFMRRGTEFAMNEVVDDKGRITTRGKVELKVVTDELKQRGRKGIELVNTALAMTDQDIDPRQAGR